MVYDVDWQRIRARGKEHFIFISSLQAALLMIIGSTVAQLVWNYFKGKLSLHVVADFISSKLVWDYLIVNIFWLLMLWLAVSFFYLLIWTVKESNHQE